MIANAFPPEGAAGVYRPLRFVRHLPCSGWHPHVVAADQYYYERYDPALLAMIPHQTEVVRVRGHDPWQAFQARRVVQLQNNGSSRNGGSKAPLRPTFRSSVRSYLSQKLRTIEAWSYHPDRSMLWIQPAVKATVALCASKQPKIIWATAGPVSSLIVAQKASQRTGIPYMIDFRDAWTITYNKFEASRPKWAILRDRKRMYRLLEGAQAVSFRYHTEAECYWHAYPGALNASRIHIIPNGYEGTVETFDVPKGELCRILYAGTLESYRYDTLLQALKTFKHQDLDRAAHLRMSFVGEEAENLMDQASALGVADLIEISGPKSHHEITRLQSEAHGLLILGRPSTMKGYELFAGAKLFGYLKVGRPIVGILPADETRKILRRVGSSTVADADSATEIVALLKRLVDAWSNDRLHLLAPDAVACAAYSAPQQTGALVRALEGMPAVDPFLPGRVVIPPSLRRDLSCGAWINSQSFARG